VGAGDRLQDVGERAQLRVREAIGEVLADHAHGEYRPAQVI
jgi:hypothetical protein